MRAARSDHVSKALDPFQQSVAEESVLRKVFMQGPDSVLEQDIKFSSWSDNNWTTTVSTPSTNYINRSLYQALTPTRIWATYNFV